MRAARVREQLSRLLASRALTQSAADGAERPTELLPRMITKTNYNYNCRFVMRSAHTQTRTHIDRNDRICCQLKYRFNKGEGKRKKNLYREIQQQMRSAQTNSQCLLTLISPLIYLITHKFVFKVAGADKNGYRAIESFCPSILSILLRYIYLGKMYF